MVALLKHSKSSNLAQKIFEIHARVKKCHFGHFSERLIWHFLPMHENQNDQVFWPFSSRSMQCALILTELLESEKIWRRALIIGCLFLLLFFLSISSKSGGPWLSRPPLLGPPASESFKSQTPFRYLNYAHLPNKRAGSNKRAGPNR